MPDLPVRPREHQLEEESKIEFQQALPAGWIYRPKIPDYGIDGEVELVTSSGAVTGRLFNVQLKGTDEADATKALRVSLRTSTLRYFAELDLPVLVVRYHAPSKKIYARWSSDFELPVDWATQSTVTLRFDPADEWRSDTATRISFELEGFRLLRSEELPLPIAISVTVSEPMTNGFSDGELIRAIRTTCEIVPGLLRVVPGPTASHFTVRISPTQTDIDVAKLGRFAFKTAVSLAGPNPLRSLGADVGTGLGFALVAAGYPRLAGRLFASLLDQSSAINDSEAALMAALCMASDDRVNEALRLAERAVAQGQLSASQILYIGVRAALRPLNEDELTRMRTLLEEVAGRSAKAGNDVMAAAAHYNLGNLLRSIGNNRVATAQYRKAAECNPQYRDRGYFWRELAGILFSQRHFDFAARFYKKALELGEQGDCRALYADALFFAGRYVEAEHAFDQYASETEYPESEWALKSWILPVVRKVSGIDTQVRRPILAMQLAAPPRATEDEHEANFKRSLQEDALSGLAWFNEGISLAHKEYWDQAAFCFTVAALAKPNDMQAWCHAIAMAMNARNVNLLGHLVSAGYFINGESLVDSVVHFAEQQPSGFPSAVFLSSFNELVSILPRRYRLEIRRHRMPPRVPSQDA
jgi:tetratricopeptide (TPR) repeat protein